jgi:hypothetical protein
MRRIPLWWTIVPLVVGGLAYWHFWSGWRDTLRADLAAVMPGVPVTIGGFPYRLEAGVAQPAWRLDGPVALRLDAVRALVNRNPWQRDLTVVRTEQPAAVAATPLAGVTAHATAAAGVSSVHLGPDGSIARLSTVFTGLHAVTGLFAAPMTAPTFEVHLRETRARSNEAWSVTPPQQAQVVLSGTGVRFGNGVPLTLDLDAGVTAVARLRDYAGWAAGGTVEIRAATLADAGGEVARLTATAVPVDGTLRLTGTVTTVCPASVRAAIDGTVAPPESRLRNPVRLAFGGTPGFFVLAAVPLDAPTAVRGQLPPCPRLS